MPELTTSRRVMLALAGVGGVLGAVQIRDRWKLRNHRRALRSERTADDMFDPSLIEGLPEAAQRYLRHAIAPGTPLARRVELTMGGGSSVSASAGWHSTPRRHWLHSADSFGNRTFSSVPVSNFREPTSMLTAPVGSDLPWLVSSPSFVLAGQPSTIRRPVGFSPSQFGSPRAFFRQWEPSGRELTTDGRA